MFLSRPLNGVKCLISRAYNGACGTCLEGILAEGGGFEPPEACTSAVFKTAAFDLSAIPPYRSVPLWESNNSARARYFTAKPMKRTMTALLGEVLEWSNRAAC